LGLYWIWNLDLDGLISYYEIYINYIFNLYKYNLNNTFDMKDEKTISENWLKKELQKLAISNNTIKDLMNLSTKLYEKAYNALDILKLLENHKFLENKLTIEKRYELLICFNRVRKELRNEKLLILFILNFLFLSSELSLENITFM
jgi:hypothetical protein